MSERYKIRIIILSLIVSIMACFLLLIKLDAKTYDTTCSNPPHRFWLEEDLEIVFLTTQVNVLEIDDHGDGFLIVKACIYDEGDCRTYRCLYTVKRRGIADFVWKFERYV